MYTTMDKYLEICFVKLRYSQLFRNTKSDAFRSLGIDIEYEELEIKGE